MTVSGKTADELQFEALLIARAYLYEMFHHLCGGVPTAELLEALGCEATQDVMGEYESIEDMNALRRLLASYAGMDAVERVSFLDAAKDEYTRIFIGPASLPASPYESPYRGSHDTALLQENTLAVREAYRSFGLEPKRLYAIPDDHIAFLCSFMAKRAERAQELWEVEDREALAQELKAEGAFMAVHLLGWLDIFAKSVATSVAAASNVLYPMVLRALSAFVKADSGFVLEGAAWLREEGRETQSDENDCPAEMLELVECSFASAKEGYAALQQIAQVGLEDYLLVQI